MNINQILTEGEGLVLTSVTVKEDYGLKKGPHRALLIEDASGKTILKIWGAAANPDMPPGSVITVQGVGPEGSIKVNEWQGKKSLNANSCEIAQGGVLPAPQPIAAPPQAYAQPAPAQAPYSPPVARQADGRILTPDELADAQCAHFGRIVKRIAPHAEAMGADPSSVLVAAAQMTGTADGWWFGHKYPGYVG